MNLCADRAKPTWQSGDLAVEETGVDSAIELVDVHCVDAVLHTVVLSLNPADCLQESHDAAQKPDGVRSSSNRVCPALSSRVIEQLG